MAIYKDMGFDFINEPQEGSASKQDIDAINQSIKNILFTIKGEVPFDPLFGSGIGQLLFEKMTPVTEILLRDEIRFSLQNHEPRIVINNIEIRSDYDYNKYDVDIEYKIIYLDTISSVQVDLSLQGI